MKLSFLLLLALLAGTGLFYWRGRWTIRTVNAAVPSAATQTAPRLLLGVSTVLTTHSFPLALYRHSPIKHLYVEGGQYVRENSY
jgi:hypothetical protein